MILGWNTVGRERNRKPREEWTDVVRISMSKDFIQKYTEDREFWKSKIYLG